MKQTFKPILFNTDMVQAILEDRKNQTRRTKGLDIVNQDPENFKFQSFSADFNYITFKNITTGLYQSIKNTIGKPGDILWVRETWQYSDDLSEPFLYRQKYEDEHLPEYHNDMKWKPSIFMPKEACRIFLKIRSIRVERLQDITREDAIKEGLYKEWDDTAYWYKNYYNTLPSMFKNPIASFVTLWKTINGVNSWNNNPWVWVITFERIDKPQGFN